MMNDSDNPVAKLRTTQAAFLSIWGMDCQQCARLIRQKLLSLDGVLLAEVYLEKRLASAAYDPQRVTPTDLVCAVDRAANDGRHEYAAELISVVPAAQALGL
jgi:copper chaperone CopZ